MSDRRTRNKPSLSRRITSAMRSEFGRVIENLMDVSGAMGAVLVDDDGYAIDYVYDPAVLRAIDIQLIGAQLGQLVLFTQTSAIKLGLGTPTVLLEGDRGNLIVAPLGEHYVLAFSLHRQANVAQGLTHFEAVRSTVEHLLA